MGSANPLPMGREARIDMSMSAEVYGIAFTVLFNVGPIFQVVKIMRSGSSENNSYGMWLCGVFGQVCVLMYCYELQLEGLFNYVNSVMGLVLNCVMVGMIWVYRKGRR